MKINYSYPGQVSQKPLKALMLGLIFQRLDLANYVGGHYVCIMFFLGIISKTGIGAIFVMYTHACTLAPYTSALD
jgi:hypothetical protein